MNQLDAESLASLKRQAAERAVDWVEPGMVVGLGSGSTALFAVRRIGQLLSQGPLRDIVAVPTSLAVEAEARRLKIPLAPLDNPPQVDLTIDGADEVDPRLNLVKGRGGALVREKIVAELSRREVIVIDQTKLSPHLGTRSSVPVEVVPFAWQSHKRNLEKLGARVALRQTSHGRAYQTDQQNFILDCKFGPIDQPAELAARIAAHAGIVGHGLFLDLATDLIVAAPEGLRHLTRAAMSGA
jgi:ribose 5-phosphate isomerase A